MNLVKARRMLEKCFVLKWIVLSIYRLTFIGFNKVVLSSFERLFSGRSRKYPPVFIIGAPRSGSTLLYQAVTDYFDVGYFSNLHRVFFGFPGLAERLFRVSNKKRPSAYASYYGYVGRWRAPSEGDEYWNRFFTRRPAYAPRWSVGEGRILRLQRSISCLVRAARKPVVFKNLYLSVRLWPLVDHFPDALFIVVRRDEVANAHSILKARKELTGSYGSWFSVEPRRYERLKRLPVYKQAVEQIRDIYGLIAEVKEECDGSRFLEIDYEEFCKDTRREMSRMASFFARHGLHPRRRFDIPRRFKVRKKVAIDRRLYKRMAAYARKRS